MLHVAHSRILTKPIWIVSLVSLFTDVASEMLYPVMPVYLRSIGFTILLIGILEGLVEAVAGLSKGYFGNLSDRIKSRVPFIRAGYTLSAISKPLLAVSILPVWVFLCRTMDRLGKGIRTSARDIRRVVRILFISAPSSGILVSSKRIRSANQKVALLMIQNFPT